MKHQVSHCRDVFLFSLGPISFSRKKRAFSCWKLFIKEKSPFSLQLFQLFSERWIKSESISITWGLYFILTNLISLQFCRLGVGPGSVASDFTDTILQLRASEIKLSGGKKRKRFFLSCPVLLWMQNLDRARDKGHKLIFREFKWKDCWTWGCFLVVVFGVCFGWFGGFLLLSFFFYFGGFVFTLGMFKHCPAQ